MNVDRIEKLVRLFGASRASEMVVAADGWRGGSGGSIEVYSAAGRRVARVPLDAAQVLWDGRDAQGRALPSGLYFARLADAPGGASTKFLLLH